MLDKSKFSSGLIKFLSDRNIPEEKWEEYLEQNSTVIDIGKFSIVDNSFLQGTMDEISLLGVKIINL